MKSRLLFFLALLLAVSAVAADRWRSPDKFYSITPPAGWKQSESGPSYAFSSPDGKAEIRISAAYHLTLPERLPDDLLELAFRKEHGITPIKTLRGTEWDGLRREYTDIDESWRWLGFIARRGSTVVLLTMKAPAKEFEHFRNIFEATSQSLTLGE